MNLGVNKYFSREEALELGFEEEIEVRLRTWRGGREDILAGGDSLPQDTLDLGPCSLWLKRSACQ